MIDYDKLRQEREDLDFTIGGESFHIQMMPMSIIGVWTEREDPVDVSKVTDFMQMMVERVADSVDDGNGSRERWEVLCADDKRGPSYGELIDLGRKVWEAQTALPTKQPGPSQPGLGDTAPSSKAA